MANRTKRPVTSTGHPNPVSGSLSIENEIERSRETERWEKVIEKADQLRQRPDKAAVLADFLIGEAKLEEYMKLYPTPNAARKKISAVPGSSSSKADKLKIRKIRLFTVYQNEERGLPEFYNNNKQARCNAKFK